MVVLSEPNPKPKTPCGVLLWDVFFRGFRGWGLGALGLRVFIESMFFRS